MDSFWSTSQSSVPKKGSPRLQGIPGMQESKTCGQKPRVLTNDQEKKADFHHKSVKLETFPGSISSYTNHTFLSFVLALLREPIVVPGFSKKEQESLNQTHSILDNGDLQSPILSLA